MLKSNTLKLARQGQVDAISLALNYVIQTLAVSARTIIEAETIIFIVKKEDGIPPKEAVKKYIQNFLVYLQIPFVRQVEIYAKDISLQWFSQFSIEYLESKQTDSRASENIADEATSNYSDQTQERRANSAFSTKANRASEAHIAEAAKGSNSKEDEHSNTGNTASASTSSQMPDPVEFEQLPKDVQQSIKTAGLRQGGLSQACDRYPLSKRED